MSAVVPGHADLADLIGQAEQTRQDSDTTAREGPDVTGPARADADRAETGRRMRAIAAELTAAGLDTHLHETHGVLDIRATLHRTGSKPVEIIYDEDGYAQVSYWNDPAATPAQIAAVLSRALGVITRPF